MSSRELLAFSGILAGKYLSHLDSRQNRVAGLGRSEGSVTIPKESKQWPKQSNRAGYPQ